ncbi:MAG: BREX system Lon protease-like protein BrxL [Desulfovibrio sp.]|nr:BREX system Lon protease-like protein BrxL [Desulfovibrio sp.]
MADEKKLREFFPETTVYKAPDITAMFKSASIPSFMRDWILKKKAGANGRISDMTGLQEYVSAIVPNRDALLALKDEARELGASRKFLTRIEVEFDSRADNFTFAIPDLGLRHSDTLIPGHVWDRIKSEVIATGCGWGLVQLGYQPPGQGHKNGHILLHSYRNFCPYKVDLAAFKEARAAFSAREWLEIIFGALDYNPHAFEDDRQRITFLSRILPFVEARLNLVELAPKGTGKSYIFGRVGKYGWLVSGGTVSRAKLFGDLNGRAPGMIASNDFVALDEIQSIQFSDPGELQGGLKAYMESGEVTVGKTRITGKAGVILLGNIPAEDMDESKDMFKVLPPIFHESALLDRFHGFISGKHIPRMNQDMILRGWGLNSEYFCEILHKLREPAEALRFRSIVESLISHPANADTRDTEAVLRLSAAWLKLLFPHIKSADDISPEEFSKWCLEPAVNMRSIIRKQLARIDPLEYGSKQMASYEAAGR